MKHVSESFTQTGKERKEREQREFKTNMNS